MRIGRLTNSDREVTAVQRDGRWFALSGDHPERAPSVLDALEDGRFEPDTEPLPDDCRPAVPYRPPRNVICLGKNFRAHAEEFAAYRAEAEATPSDPIVFTKAPESLCGAADEIVVAKGLAGALDYEAELGVIIGRGGCDIDVDGAHAHVAGYTVINDLTARDLQSRHAQWFLGKSLPRATPIGPMIVTPDELPDLDTRKISCTVNGEPRQSALLGEMVFGIAETISIVSKVTPLVRGDIISMGTPAGVGIGFSPPRYLRDGDEVVCAIEGIGELRNVVRVVDAMPGC
jgi:2-keto-4-pentenoate hydratase/2-oxohepta-3-ene-1,7-dioic acid hydratase in catechol pathway